MSNTRSRTARQTRPVRRTATRAVGSAATATAPARKAASPATYLDVVGSLDFAAPPVDDTLIPVAELVPSGPFGLLTLADILAARPGAHAARTVTPGPVRKDVPPVLPRHGASEPETAPAVEATAGADLVPAA